VRTTSLRRRLTLVLAIGFAAVVGGAGFVTTRSLTSSATEDFDVALRGQAHALAALTEREAGHVELDYVPAAMPEFEREKDPQHFQIWLDDGRVLYRSKRLSGDLPRSTAGTPGASDTLDATLSSGAIVRVVRLAFVPGTSDEPDVGDTAARPPPAGAPPPSSAGTVAPPRVLLLSVARSRDRLDATLSTMRWQVLGGAAVAILLGLLLVWRALASAFAPVDAIAAQVRALEPGRPGARVDVPRTPAELAPVVALLNALLDRMAASLERERRFTGNVAHELRTPIADLRSLCAVASRWPGDARESARFFEDAGAVARRMDRLVADLLLLARCQAGAEPVDRAPVSLARVIAAAAAAHEAAARERGLRVRLDVPDDLVAESDEGKLGIVFGNLLGNAVAYARSGTEVSCEVVRDGARFRVEVRNDAESLSSADLARLAEPFWRADAAHSSPDHAGLGLSLVAALAVPLRLDVRFEQRGGTFVACVEGPASPRPGPSDVARPPVAHDRQRTLRLARGMERQGGPS